MSTIDNKNLIDKIIANDGCYEDDPRVFMIVEYTNTYGNRTWGVTWVNESESQKFRYCIETEYVRNPKTIWTIQHGKIVGRQMNTCVSDDQLIVNIQGIRNVTWGETNSVGWANPGKPWFITITYKGSHNFFYYKTESEAKDIFNKIRDKMDKK